jgi:hypothetical protein
MPALIDLGRPPGGHAGADRSVADDGDGVTRGLAHVARDGKAQGGRDRGGGMGGAKGVMRALGAFGEAREAALLAQGADAVTPPGQDLVGIALVAHVPDELVAGRVKDGVNRDGQFDHAQ